jgi:peptidoglycan/LPS O-acetylase OafA/YrhL
MKTFAGLEICRFLCALSVIIWHYQHFFTHGVLGDSISSPQIVVLPLYSLLAPFYQHGFAAVQVFWVISGFIFFWKYSDPIYRRSINATQFFILRFSRLYPLHFATLIIVAALQYLYTKYHGVSFIYGQNNSENFALQLAFASNWLGRQKNTFNGPIWSVSVEVLVYAGFFITIRFIRPGLSLCAIIVFVAKILLHFHYQVLVSCVLFFFAGSLTQQLVKRLSAKWQKIGFFCASACLSYIIFSVYFGHSLSETYLLILSTGVVFCFAAIGTTSGRDISKWNWLGQMTYSAYLIHFPIQLATVLILDAVSINSRDVFISPFVLIVFLSTTFGSAWVVYRIFEMPMQNAIRSKTHLNRAQAA